MIEEGPWVSHQASAAPQPTLGPHDLDLDNYSELNTGMHDDAHQLAGHTTPGDMTYVSSDYRPPPAASGSGIPSNQHQGGQPMHQHMQNDPMLGVDYGNTGYYSLLYEYQSVDPARRARKQAMRGQHAAAASAHGSQVIQLPLPAFQVLRSDAPDTALTSGVDEATDGANDTASDDEENASSDDDEEASDDDEDASSDDSTNDASSQIGMFPNKYQGLNNFLLEAAKTRFFKWTGEKPELGQGPPRTPTSQRAMVKELFDAAYNFDAWTQVPIQSPRSVESICKAKKFSSPIEKMDRIMGSAATCDVEDVEGTMWNILATAVRIRDIGLEMPVRETDPKYEKYDTFAARLDQIVKGFKANKSLVKDVVTDSKSMIRYILRPLKELQTKEGNKKVNLKKQEYLKEGQIIKRQAKETSSQTTGDDPGDENMDE
ncbi:hypothetical protein F5X68DRAFT_192329 [Plectosphaerella plurivora]|uniref:Uncharacterized protein n=1 Tax=Plectosphaerella plurivora TaxID=936078 RepID=A0A9P9A9X9_9PEZI|nr:hypothetical protein F5X68DRAFT_192329 [Plectosphaerella plurivora]